MPIISSMKSSLGVLFDLSIYFSNKKHDSRYIIIEIKVDIITNDFIDTMKHSFLLISPVRD